MVVTEPVRAMVLQLLFSYHNDKPENLVHELITGRASNDGLSTGGLFVSHTGSPSDAHKDNTWVGSLPTDMLITSIYFTYLLY